jgi:hypothetical protein
MMRARVNLITADPDRMADTIGYIKTSVRPAVVRSRCGAGGICSRFSTRRIVDAPTRTPRPSSSPWIRLYPQLQLSSAICSISAASLASTGGLPTRWG